MVSSRVKQLMSQLFP